jgi:hypothetical protein
MKIVDTLLYTERGQIVVSILIGFGVASLFKPICVSNCTHIHSPNIKNIENEIFKFDGQCFIFKPRYVGCTKNSIEKHNQNVEYSSI